MSILPRLVAWLRLLTRPERKVSDPEQLALRDWADLPSHHPRCS